MRTALVSLALFAACSSGPPPRVAPASPPAPAAPAPADAATTPIAEPSTPPAPEEPAPPTSADELFFVMENGGMLRFADARLATFHRELAGVRDAALGPDGRIYVLTGAGVQAIQAEEVQALPAVPGGLELGRLAVTSDGVLYGLGGTGIARFDGAAWTVTGIEAIAGRRAVQENWFFLDFASDGERGLIVLERLRLYQLRAGRPIPLVAPGRMDARNEGIAAGADGTVALLRSGAIHRRESAALWTTAELPGERVVVRSVSVGADGTIVGAALQTLFFVPKVGPATRFELSALTASPPSVYATARDAEGRTWVSTDRGILLLSPSNQGVYGWRREDLPGQSVATEILVRRR